MLVNSSSVFDDFVVGFFLRRLFEHFLYCCWHCLHRINFVYISGRISGDICVVGFFYIFVKELLFIAVFMISMNSLLIDVSFDIFVYLLETSCSTIAVHLVQLVCFFCFRWIIK